LCSTHGRREDLKASGLVNSVTRFNMSSSVKSKQDLCRRPRGTAFCNQLVSWFSPIVWWRAADFKRVDLRPLWTSCLALVVSPAVLLYLVTERSISNDGTTTTTRRQLSSVVITPWTVAFAWKAFATMQKVYQAKRELEDTKSITKESAWECLAMEVEAGRAYRTRNYDVYLPLAEQASMNKKKLQAILFFPGAYVENAAYAGAASLLAQAGYLVIVVSSEPLRLVDEWLMPVQYVKRLCAHIQKRHSIDSWILGGHSMGSFFCTKLAQPLNVKQIVMWGSGAYMKHAEKLLTSDDHYMQNSHPASYFENDSGSSLSRVHG